MRKKLVIIMMGLILICTGCGDKEDDEMVRQNYMSDTYNSVDSDWESDYESMDTQAVGGLGESYAEPAEAPAYDGGTNNKADSEPTEGGSGTQTNGSKAGTITQEMLVYRGSLNIDTLDFEASVNAFKTLISEKNGFIGEESYTDNYSNSGYYAVDEADKRNLYSATVRVPSREYDAVMNSATTLGDVRSRYSNATNVTQQYSTYQTQLEVYEAEYDRYLELLKNATEDEYALMIENELFDIQMQIATLKSGIINLETDVAYSYIDITIKEVSEYEEVPQVKDTFFERLRRTCKNSWGEFLDFMEDFLFWLIMNIYWIVVIVVIVIIVRMRRKRKVQKWEANQNMAMQAGNQNQNILMQAGNQNQEAPMQTDNRNQNAPKAEEKDEKGSNDVKWK